MPHFGNTSYDEQALQVYREAAPGYDVRGYMLDPGAGSGRTFDWQIARGVDRPLIIAGGLTPENVGESVCVMSPSRPSRHSWQRV